MRLAWFGLHLVLAAAPLAAQSGGFVATLGNDTVHVEQFTRKGNTLTGVIATRVGATRVTRYQMTFDKAGKPLQYHVDTFDGAGAPLRTDGASATLDYIGDSLIKQVLSKGEMVTQRVAAPNGAWPTPSIPYIGVSYLMYEFAIAALRERARVAPDSMIYLTYTFAGAPNPTRKRAWLVAPDSAELDYFGVARSGYRFNVKGELIRADWTGTTYRYLVQRVASIDVDAIAGRWRDADAAGKGFGALSPRDSALGKIGSAAVSLDYSRPSRRGRNIWGDVVRPGVVWRLGADVATHFATSADLLIGGTRVPAGRYTFWMLYQADGTGVLIINSKVNIFGTSYDPKADFARIPLVRHDNVPDVERLTLSVANGAIEIAWGDSRWSVAAQIAP
ncbi:MAG: DUF2911 domain-containing protein [Gemmatimonadales bacterium]